MRTISFNVSEEEEKLIEDYVNDNCLNLSEFIKDAIFEKLEVDLTLDEQRIQEVIEGKLRKLATQLKQ